MLCAKGNHFQKSYFLRRVQAPLLQGGRVQDVPHGLWVALCLRVLALLPAAQEGQPQRQRRRASLEAQVPVDCVPRWHQKRLVRRGVGSPPGQPARVRNPVNCEKA